MLDSDIKFHTQKCKQVQSTSTSQCLVTCIKNYYQVETQKKSKQTQDRCVIF